MLASEKSVRCRLQWAWQAREKAKLKDKRGEPRGEKVHSDSESMRESERWNGRGDENSRTVHSYLTVAVLQAWRRRWQRQRHRMRRRAIKDKVTITKYNCVEWNPISSKDFIYVYSLVFLVD